MSYYAVLNAEDICKSIEEIDYDPGLDTYIAIPSNDTTLIGKWYNRTTSTFVVLGMKYLNPLKEVDGAGSGLDADLLDGNNASAFATANHNHNSTYAPISHNHDTAYADIDHNHAGDYSPIGHTHSNYAPVQHTHNQYALTDHTHNQYALSDHVHSNYASSTHNHDTRYALVSHTHSYLPLSGGEIDGNINIKGLLRINGQQTLFDSGTMLTIGTNNRPTVIACASAGDITMNGSNVITPSILPRGGATRNIGTSSLRFGTIYLTNSPNVSSDERLKDNIKSEDITDLLEFIDKLRVVDYEYKADPGNERIGLIAQEVERVGGDKYIDVGNDGIYGLKTCDLIYPLIGAVQALYARVKELERD